MIGMFLCYQYLLEFSKDFLLLSGSKHVFLCVGQGRLLFQLLCHQLALGLHFIVDHILGSRKKILQAERRNLEAV